MRVNYIILCNFISVTFLCLSALGELYTSVDELSNWVGIKRRLVNILDERIRKESSKLAILHKAHGMLSRFNGQYRYQTNGISLNQSYELASDNIVLGRAESNQAHPVEAFVILNRLNAIINEIQQYYFESDCPRHDNRSLLESASNIPSYNDLVGCGEALLRLQEFYELDIDDMTYGKLGRKNIDATGEEEQKPRLMRSEDCFELGKIAYEKDEFRLALGWFQKSIELAEDEERQLYVKHSQVSDLGHTIDHDSVTLIDLKQVLEYMAFAAYSNNQIEFAATLTKLWLDRDPENEVAVGNLEYYLEELDRLQNSTVDSVSSTAIEATSDGVKREKDEDQTSSSDSYSKLDSSKYIVSRDNLVRYLCRSAPAIDKTNGRVCLRKFTFMSNHLVPEIKIEVLHSNPDVIRVYDVITDKEAHELRQMALPKLQRSTVRTKDGFTESKFRIAKTAWLNGGQSLVWHLEGRISEILNLDLGNSENLQVVNYGFGGFFGPHVDTYRSLKMSDTTPLTPVPMEKDDRLLTFLIYLNSVEIGGSTVFPRLNLSVPVVKNSAVYWFNMHKNGYVDERTLHLSCPILLGSKWIATKWIRDKANAFKRPCGLRPQD